MHAHRTQIRVDPQCLAQAEQTLLGAKTRIGIVPARATDGAKQDGVGGFAELECLGRQRSTARIERAAANQSLVQL